MSDNNDEIKNNENLANGETSKNGEKQERKTVKNDELNKNENNIETKSNDDKAEENIKTKEIDNISKSLKENMPIVEENKKRNIIKTDINKKNHKLRNTILIIVAGIVLLLLISVITLICINQSNKNVYKNVYLNEVDLSGKSREDIENIVRELSENIVKNNKKIDIYQDKEVVYSIAVTDIGLKIDVDKTVDKVMNVGRTGNVLTNNIEIIKLYFASKEIEPEFIYDNKKIDEVLNNLKLSIKNLTIDDSYSIDEKNHKLVIVRGKSGNTIDVDKARQEILNTFIDREKESYTLELINKEPQKIDVQKIYSEIKREAKDAYIDESKNPVEYVAEVVGYDLDVNELSKVLSENTEEGNTVEFKLKVIEPSKKLADIAPFNDQLATYTTYFPTGDYARCNNLKIALSYMNGVIVNPGQVYSYNSNIGDTTASKGYLPAATFKGGTTVNEMGGGICQTVSTLYNVALFANLEIVERHQHGLPVGYVPVSRDATVYSPSLDFKFKNTRKYPVKIKTAFNSNGSLTVSLYGTKEENEYEVILSQRYLSTISAPVNYIYDTNLAPGTQVVVSNGANGYTSESYITKKLNGKVVSSGLLSRDKYNAQAKIIRVGAGGS